MSPRKRWSRAAPRVAVWDDNEHAREKARAAGLRIENLATCRLAEFCIALVLSPGVPLTHPAPHWTVLKARQAGVEIIGDIELFCRERQKIAPGSPFVAITGTNGKSTTTALVAHLFRSFGFAVEVGGNIGTRFSPWRRRRKSAFMSSNALLFRSILPLAQSICRRAFEHHAGSSGSPWHDGELLRDQGKAGGKGRSRGDRHRRLTSHKRHCWRSNESGPEPTIRVSRDHNRDRREAIVLDGGMSHAADRRPSTLVADLSGIASLRGVHNGQNAAAAIAALGPLGLDLARVVKGLRSFPGLPHRLGGSGPEREGSLRQ